MSDAAKPPPRPALGLAILALLFTGSCGGGGVLPEAGKGWKEDLCVPKANWPQVESLMRSFGTAHDMEFYGSIDEMPDSVWPESQTLNYSLIRGLRELGGDDFDIWLVSDADRASHLYLAAFTRKDMTAEEVATARQFRRDLDVLTCEPGVAYRKAGRRRPS